jgi:hypothetical protein
MGYAATERGFLIALREEVPGALRVRLDGSGAQSYFCGEFNLLSNAYVVLGRPKRQRTE